MYYKEVESQQNVCPKCNHHFRISAEKRIELIVDEGSFVEFDMSLAPVDPLKFSDKKSYKKRLEEAKAKTGKTSSVMSGSCTIGGLDMEIAVFDFSFMGGRLGIGFAGQRVIKQTVGVDLPEGFQRSEFLLDHGLIDMIVDRADMRDTLAGLLKLFNKKAS